MRKEKELQNKIDYLPVINRELIQLIEKFELQYGEIIIDGRRLIDDLREEQNTFERTKSGRNTSVVFRLVASFVDDETLSHKEIINLPKIVY